MSLTLEQSNEPRHTAPPPPGGAGLLRSWGVLVALSAVFVTSALWRPSDQPTFILCVFRAATGYPCPGCGMTHAFCAIGHGEWQRAISYNPFSPLVFVAFLLIWAHALALILKARPVQQALERLRPNALMSKVLLALVLVWWAARLHGGF